MKRWTLILYSVISTWLVDQFAQLDGWSVFGYKKWIVCIALAICLTVILCEVERLIKEVIKR